MRKAILFATIFLAGCGTFRAAAPNIVVGLQQHQLTPETYSIVGPVYGSECGKSILYILHIDPASAMEAYKNALESKSADFILEPRTEVEFHNYLVYQKFCVHVWGLGAKLR
ncbi:MAG: hypothetical protein HYT87_15885 [Nitrospirae bacterium]|nr:hypothetical protein [Nitrospirota bacterium]